MAKKPARHYDPRRGAAKRSAAKRASSARHASGSGRGRARGDHLSDREFLESVGLGKQRPGRERRDRKQRRAEQPRERYRPEIDEVLARISAKVTSASDVAGVTFGDLGLGDNLVRALDDLGANEPFPIQAATIPDVLAGHHVLGRARTGSGKTIAFGAALVERLLRLKADGAFAGDPPPVMRAKLQRGKRNPRGRERTTARKPKALVLAPTRELALQIDRTVQPLARSVGLFTTQLVGGLPQERQVEALRRGVDIVIGTPGRLEDLIDQRHLDLRDVRIVVIDEADHMCELGFLEPVQRLVRGVKRGAQMLLYSATLDQRVGELVAEFLPEHRAHEVAGDDEVSGSIDHRVYAVRRDEKLTVLLELAKTPGKVLIFTRTRVFAETLTQFLDEAGVDAVALHGDLSQARRSRNLQKLSRGQVNVLVATDVAARGIHVDDIDLVVQADPPDDYKTYLHRSGRTGRAGETGVVVTLVQRGRERRMRELLQRAEVEPSVITGFGAGDRFVL